MRIELPWPPKDLSPNERPHWTKKAKAVKAYRTECGWRARAQGVNLSDVTPVHMQITFAPPDARRRDRDNMIASCKALMDGLSDAIGIDDRHFIPTYQIGEIRKGGAVIVEIAYA
jgi:crossover junction endodeoxyribonuclease RusA